MFPLLMLAAIVAAAVPGILIAVGASKMLRLKSYGWAVTASILALLPCSPVGLLGLVIGIWSLVVLNRKQVREAFARPRGRLVAGSTANPAGGSPGVPQPGGGASSAQRSSSSWPAVLIVLAVVAVIAIPAVLTLGMVFAYWFVVGRQ
jgi:hypothetical protein